MATIESIFSPGAGLTSYIAPVASADLWQTQIPRGEVNFIVTGGAVTLSGVGDDQKITIRCNLPRGYAYTLVESNMNLNAVDIADWANVTRFRMRDSIATSRWTIHQRFEASSTIIKLSSTNLNKAYQLIDPPAQKMIVCDQADTGRLEVQWMNDTTNAAAGSLDFYARFLQFDLNQAFFWAVNTPALVR